MSISFLYLWKYIFTLGMFVLSIRILTKNNEFDKIMKTAKRFLISVIALWIGLIFLIILISYIDPLLVSTEEEKMNLMNDGGGNVIALLFGWVYGIVFTIFAWILVRIWRLRLLITKVFNRNT